MAPPASRRLPRRVAGARIGQASAGGDDRPPMPRRKRGVGERGRAGPRIACRRPPDTGADAREPATTRPSAGRWARGRARLGLGVGAPRSCTQAAHWRMARLARRRGRPADGLRSSASCARSSHSARRPAAGSRPPPIRLRAADHACGRRSRHGGPTRGRPARRRIHGTSRSRRRRAGARILVAPAASHVTGTPSLRRRVAGGGIERSAHLLLQGQPAHEDRPGSTATIAEHPVRGVRPPRRGRDAWSMHHCRRSSATSPFRLDRGDTSGPTGHRPANGRRAVPGSAHRRRIDVEHRADCRRPDRRIMRLLRDRIGQGLCHASRLLAPAAVPVRRARPKVVRAIPRWRAPRLRKCVRRLHPARVQSQPCDAWPTAYRF